MDNNFNFIENKNEKEQRKLFANKKANIALGILGAVIVIGIIGVAIWAYI